MFYFNTDKYDFWKIFESISKYYPVGISKNEPTIYFNYPGLKELEALIVDNIQNENNFKNRWINFDRTIELKVKKEVIGSTYGQAPCFSSFIELERVSIGNLSRIKELYYFVSLLGPFYTIIGQDRNEIQIDNDKIYSTNFLTVSPEKEYKDTFAGIEIAIRNKFENYRFVPFDIYKQEIEGLDVGYTDEKFNTVFNALFNDQIDLDATVLGDDFYQAESWIIEGFKESVADWTVYPPQSS